MAEKVSYTVGGQGASTHYTLNWETSVASSRKSENQAAQCDSSLHNVFIGLHYIELITTLMVFPLLQKPANILVMGDGPERGRVKIGGNTVCTRVCELTQADS